MHQIARIEFRNAKFPYAIGKPPSPWKLSILGRKMQIEIFIGKAGMQPPKTNLDLKRAWN